MRNKTRWYPSAANQDRQTASCPCPMEREDIVMGSGDGDAASSAGSKPNSLSRAPKTPQSQQSPHKPTVSAEPPKPHSLSRATLSTLVFPLLPHLTEEETGSEKLMRRDGIRPTSSFQSCPHYPVLCLGGSHTPTQY